MEAEKYSTLSNPEVLGGLKSRESEKSSSSPPKTVQRSRNWQ